MTAARSAGHDARHAFSDIDVPVRAILRTSDVDEARAFCRRLFYPPLTVRPTGRTGRFAFHGDVVRIGPVTVGRLSYGTGILMDAPGLYTGYHVLAPITGSVLARHRGIRTVAGPELAAVFSPVGDVSLLFSGDCTLLSVKVDRLALERELGGAHADESASPLQLGASFCTASGPGRSWTALTGLLHTELQRTDGLAQQPAMARGWQRLIVRGLALTVDLPAGARAPAASRPRTVKRVIDVMQADPAGPFTAADLAAVAGVGIRVLQESFRQHVGMSPFTYLRMLRLDRVHTELSRAEPGQAGISEVAYRWGFTHLGRFAGAYRARYGEAPSQTLRERR